MIRLSIENEFLTKIIQEISPRIEMILPIKGIVVVPPGIKFFFVKSIIAGLDLRVPVKASFSFSDNADLLINIRVLAGLVEQMASAAAAKIVAEKLGCISHGGTVIYPLKKYIAGAQILLTKEHLSLVIRPLGD